jgi:DnaJ-class molecular chaperone
MNQNHIADWLNSTARCPWCDGFGFGIDRFNHWHFGDCPLCKGKGRLKKDHPLILAQSSRKV